MNTPAAGPTFTAPQAEQFGRLWDEFARWFAETEPRRHRPSKATRRQRKAAYLAARRAHGPRAVKNASLTWFCPSQVEYDLRIHLDGLCVPTPAETDNTVTLSQ